MVRRIAWFGLCWLLASTSQAFNNFVVTDEIANQPIEVSRDLYWVDNVSSFEELLEGQLQPGTLLWKHIDQLAWRSGSLWTSFLVTNQSLQNHKMLLYFQDSLILKLSVRMVSSRGEEHFAIGAAYPFSERPINSNRLLLPLQLAPGESVRFLLEMDNTGINDVPIFVGTETNILSEIHLDNLLWISLLSMIFFMVIFNLGLFMSSGHPMYLTHSFFSAALFISIFFTFGFIYQVLPFHFGIWTFKFFLVVVALIPAILVMFPMDLAQTETRHPFIHVYFKAIQVIALATALASLTPMDAPALKVSLILNAITMLGMLVASLHFLRKGYRQFRLYALSWFVFFFGAMTLIMSQTGILNQSWMTNYSLLAGLYLGFTLFSLTLVSRFNYERKERQMAEKKSLENLHAYYEIYLNAGEGIFTSTLDGRLLDANPAFCTMLGIDDLKQVLQDPNFNVEQVYKNRGDRKSVIDDLLNHHKVNGRELEGISLTGRQFWAALYLRLSEESGQQLIKGTIIDITDRKASEQKLEYLANHDSLTGLANRRAFYAALDKHLHSDFSIFALMYIDLDQFKIVNDSCGHSAGDHLLMELSELMAKSLPSNSILARVGGDEFAAIILCNGANHAYHRAEELLAVIRDYRFEWDDQRFSISGSIGLVLVDQLGISSEEWLSRVDTACYAAKEEGRNRVIMFDTRGDEPSPIHSELKWVNIIEQSLDQNEFILFCQQILPLNQTDNGYHYEILLRLIQEEALVAPGQFLPAAERYNLIIRIDQWVINRFFNWLALHPDHLEHLELASINLSGQSLNSPDLARFLQSQFLHYQIPPQKICFEITESIAITNLERTEQLIKNFRAQGCRFALDDFGTGFSSYAYLKNLRIDYLKIDGSFVKDMTVDPGDHAMVKSIHDVARAMGLETIAEFVENEKIVASLKEIGVDYGQGYGIAKPQPLNELAQIALGYEDDGNEPWSSTGR